MRQRCFATTINNFNIVSKPSFPEFENRIRDLLAEKKYLQIINLIEDEGDLYPNQHTYLAYWQVGMAARDNNIELAVEYLDQMIEEGLWISQFLLRTSPSFENLQGDLNFEERVDIMSGLQRREAAQLLPLLALRQEDKPIAGGQPFPLLLGLHKGRGTQLDSIKFWQPAAAAGWLVGVPQSGQALWSGAYVWEDLGQTQQELTDHVRGLAQKYTIDPRRVIVAGHEQGGEMAAWLPLSGGMDVRGFIAVAPTGGQIANPDRWFHMLQASEPSGMRGVFITGENDSPYLPEIKRLVDILNAFDVPAKLEILPGVGSEFHPAYQEALLQAIHFILT